MPVEPIPVPLEQTERAGARPCGVIDERVVDVKEHDLNGCSRHVTPSVATPGERSRSSASLSKLVHASLPDAGAPE